MNKRDYIKKCLDPIFWGHLVVTCLVALVTGCVWSVVAFVAGVIEGAKDFDRIVWKH